MTIFVRKCEASKVTHIEKDPTSEYNDSCMFQGCAKDFANKCLEFIH